MSRRFWLTLVASIGAICCAQSREPQSAPVPLASPIQDKNFYLLSLLQRTAGARDAMKHEPALAAIAASRRASVSASCGLRLECYSAHYSWSEADMAAVSAALKELYRTSNDVKGVVDGPLRESGMYIHDSFLAGPELLERAWLECARGMNRMIAVYGLGEAPRYPAIDSMTYDAKSANWQRDVQSLAAVIDDQSSSLELFFEPSLKFATELMWLNHRDEAGRFEPMELGENAAAFQRAKSLDWNKYPYSVIVVPGAGNDRPGVRLSPGGKLRDEIAAKRFRDGLAPFVLVSGGYVHPERTEFSEAVEMKRDLMTRFGIPADAILIDPHARHTTTNMRNAARLIFRYGLPFNKKALVSTDLSQSQYIENPAFEKRCKDELKYVPYRLLGRTSPFDLEFLPQLDSLQSDPEDPLDP